MIDATFNWFDNLIFRALPGNADGEHTALMMFVGTYFTIIIGAATTVLYIHLTDPSGDGKRIKDLFGIVDRKEAERKELEELAIRRKADQAAWDRSKAKVSTSTD